MWNITTDTVSHIAQIFVPEKRKEIGSVVGGFETTRAAIEFKTSTALIVLAFISLSLGIINLFPFLPLDGGHIFWSVVEKVRGRPVSFLTMERAGMIGFALVIMLFFIGLTNDIGRITGDGINVR
jgi:regulator of sigma E protease